MLYWRAGLWPERGLGFASQQPVPARAESLLHYVDDATITAEIKEAIYANPLLKILDIDVETSRGAVTLSGSVSTLAQDYEAVELTRNVVGVTSISDVLVVREMQPY